MEHTITIYCALADFSFAAQCVVEVKRVIYKKTVIHLSKVEYTNILRT